MEKYVRPVAVGVTVGSIAAALFFGFSHLPSAWANEQPAKTLLSTAEDFLPHQIDVGNIVRFDDAAYLVTADDSVSLHPLRTVTVGKIGFGKKHSVKIVTTATGVYSSEGMLSPHFRYPGIEVEPLPDWQFDDHHPGHGFAEWLPNRGWIGFSARSADSLILVTPSGSCFLTRNTTIC